MNEQKQNIGIILSHLAPSQINEEVIGLVNQQKNTYSIYFENLVPSYRDILAPIFNVSECLYLRGRLIATGLSSAQYLLSSLQHIERILYLYDIEWLRGQNNFIENVKILRDNRIKIYTRSDDYAKLIGNYCNRQIEVQPIQKVICGNYST